MRRVRPSGRRRSPACPAQQIEEFAKLYCSTQRAYIRIGYGFARSRNGAASMHAVTCLPTVTGKWQHEGAGALWSYRSICNWDKTLIEGLDAIDPATRILDMSRLASVLTGDRDALRDGPPVHAMLIQNSNPATVAPDTNRVRRGFMRDDLFVAVHEQFMTETALLADIVLPATMFMEHDDLYQAGGHSHIQIGAKLIEPPGECRPNHAVLQGLAARLGARHRGFEMTEMEIIDETLRVSGWPDARTVLEQRWIDIAPPFADAHFHHGFPQKDKRFHFAPDWRAIGPDWARMPVLPDYMPATDEATPDRPFRMVTAPSRHFLNTCFTETPTSRQREGRPTVLLHPADAARVWHRRWRSRAARQCARRGRAACASVRRAAAGCRGGGKRVAERRVRRRHRHQRTDQRRPGTADGWRGVPRYRGVAASRGCGNAAGSGVTNRHCHCEERATKQSRASCARTL